MAFTSTQSFSRVKVRSFYSKSVRQDIAVSNFNSCSDAGKSILRLEETIDDRPEDEDNTIEDDDVEVEGDIVEEMSKLVDAVNILDTFSVAISTELERVRFESTTLA